MSVSHADDPTPPSPEVGLGEHEPSESTRRPSSYAEYEQNPRGPATIIGGILVFLFAVIFASFVVGPAQYAMFAVMIAAALCSLRGFVQMARDKRRGQDVDER